MAVAIFKLANTFTQLQSETQTAIAEIKQRAIINNRNKTAIDFTQELDIQKPGDLSWQRETFTLFDRKRDRSSLV